MPGQRRRRRFPRFLVTCELLLAAGAACAQTPLHVRGTLIEFPIWGQPALVLRAKALDGSEIAIQAAFNWEAYPVAPVDRARVVDGSYVGVVAVSGGAGAPRATAVLLYPEHMRGTLEGQHAWDSAPGSTMTNATLIRRVADGDAQVWTLRDAQGEHAIRVDRDVPWVTTGPGGHNFPIAAGSPLFVNATRQRDGTITAGRIYYGEGGFVPPL